MSSTAPISCRINILFPLELIRIERAFGEQVANDIDREIGVAC